MRSAVLAAALLPLAACAPRGRVPPARDARAEARALEDETLAAYFRRHPEAATRYGIPGANHAAVTDQRLSAIAAWHAEEDRFLERARRLDRAALAGTPEGIALGILVQALEGERATRACRSELWPVSGLGSWPGRYAQLAEQQPVGTPEK